MPSSQLPPLDVTQEEHQAALKNLEGETTGSILYCIMLHERLACRERQLAEAIARAEKAEAQLQEVYAITPELESM